MPECPAALAESLRSRVGTSLRCVASYAGPARDIHYLRPDVEPKADADRVDRVHEDLVLGDIGGDYQERLFDLGALRATTRHFEEGVVVHVPGGGYAGLFVSLDPDAAGDVPAVVDACRAYLRGSADEPLVRGAPRGRL